FKKCMKQFLGKNWINEISGKNFLSLGLSKGLIKKGKVGGGARPNSIPLNAAHQPNLKSFFKEIQTMQKNPPGGSYRITNESMLAINAWDEAPSIHFYTKDILPGPRYLSRI